MRFKIYAVLLVMTGLVYAQDNAVVTVGGGIMVAMVAALLTYFFSTKNLENRVGEHAKRVAQDQVKVHERVDHQESHWDAIMIHKKECGDKFETDLEKVKDQTIRIDRRQTKSHMMLRGLSVTVQAIAKKMDVIAPPIPIDDDDVIEYEEDL